MAIKSPKSRKPEINIDGPDGNAFALLGHARNLGKQLGFSGELQERISDEMRAGDYANLIRVFDKYFGDYVDLVTENAVEYGLSEDEEDDDDGK